VYYQKINYSAERLMLTSASIPKHYQFITMSRDQKAINKLNQTAAVQSSCNYPSLQEGKNVKTTHHITGTKNV
jgi:hypothetical protein